ncbi:hypothetical protein FRB97_005143 [Tulasnella sp. 331]|nr:hypothetical protein FRB97_005143 [Tulasnella sp. 331]
MAIEQQVGKAYGTSSNISVAGGSFIMKRMLGHWTEASQWCRSTTIRDPLPTWSMELSFELSDTSGDSVNPILELLRVPSCARFCLATRPDEPFTMLFDSPTARLIRSIQAIVTKGRSPLSVKLREEGITVMLQERGLGATRLRISMDKLKLEEVERIIRATASPMPLAALKSL